MRWGIKTGERKSSVKFAWLPVKLSDDSWVWLEKFKITVELKLSEDENYTLVTKEIE